LDRNLPLNRCAIWLVEGEADKETRRQGDKETEHPAAAAAGRGPASEPPGSGSPCLVLAANSLTCSTWSAGPALAPGMRLPVDQTPLGPCLATGRALYIDVDRGAAPGQPGVTRLEEVLAATGAAACFAVPLRSGDRVAGVLHSVCKRPTGFTTEQVQLLY